MRPCIIAVLALTLAACENAPGSFQPTPFAFENPHLSPIVMNIANITVTDHYDPPLKRPNVEQDFPVRPTDAVKKWADNRLRATGTAGTLDLEIHDASVKEVALPKSSGVKGFFTDDQDARYDATLSATYRVYLPNSLAPKATGDVIITRSRSIHERASINERSAIFHAMTADIMNDFERESLARFHQYFGAYLK